MAGIVILVFGYILSQLYRSFLAVLAPILTRELGMDASELATASGAWFVAFALAQFPVGISLDNYGPRRTAAYTLAIAGGGGAALFAFADGNLAVISAMALLGIGCSAVLMAPFYLFARNLPAAKFATYSATFVAVGTLGNVLGSEPMAAASIYYGWREVMGVLAVITFTTGVAVFAAVKDPQKVTYEVGGDKKQGFFTVLGIRSMWPIYPLICVAYAVPAGVRGLWAGPLLEDLHQLDVPQIGRITLFMALAMVLGSLIYGPLDRIFKTRKWVIFAGNFLLLLVCVWFSVSIPDEVFLVGLAFVLMGLLGASYAVLMAHGKAFVPASLVGRGVTLLNFCAISGVGVLQLVSGWLVEASHDPANPANGYQSLFLMYSVVLFVCLAIYLFSKDAKPGVSEQI